MIRKLTRSIVVGVLAASTLIAAVGTASAERKAATRGSSATSGGLMDVQWAAHKAKPGDTGVIYGWSFVTGKSATLSKISMSMPAGSSAAELTVLKFAGVPFGSASLSGETLTYSFPATAIAAGTQVYVEMYGFTNTSSAGTYTSDVATHGDGSQIEWGKSGSIRIGADASGTVLAEVGGRLKPVRMR